MVPWQSSGWSNDRNVPDCLEFMRARGEVAVAGRRGASACGIWPSGIYPDDAVIPADEARRTRDEKRLRALGIARARGPECPVSRWTLARLASLPSSRGSAGSGGSTRRNSDQPFQGRAALLSPLDRLVFDRKRMTELFEFDYQLEMYKPAAKRRWGYYALPILYGDRLVGKLDATADHRAGVLRVDAIHQDAPFSEAMTNAVNREIKALAGWLKLGLDITAARAT